MFLLDTPIVFELRKARAGGAEAGLTAWAAGVARERLFLSAISLMELEVAATALEHGLTLVTRNAAAYRGARVKLFDPRDYTADTAEDEGDWRDAARTGPLWLKNLFVRA